MGAVSRMLPQTWQRPMELILLMALVAVAVAIFSLQAKVCELRTGFSIAGVECGGDSTFDLRMSPIEHNRGLARWTGRKIGSATDAERAESSSVNTHV